MRKAACLSVFRQHNKLVAARPLSDLVLVFRIQYWFFPAAIACVCVCV